MQTVDFFLILDFFFIVLGVLNDGLFSEGKYAVCFTLLLKRLKFRGCEKKSTPVEVLFTFRRRIVCRCATKYENSHWLKTHRKWKDPMYKTDNYVDVDNKQ